MIDYGGFPIGASDSASDAHSTGVFLFAPRLITNSTVFVTVRKYRRHWQLENGM